MAELSAAPNPSLSPGIVRRMASECGFDLTGFAPAGLVDADTARHYRTWIDHGYQASMGFLERKVEERLDPLRILPEARTVIVVAKNYFREEASLNPEAKISRYAGGRDYHKVLGRGMRRLNGLLTEAVPEQKSWWSVDAGPVMERYWAQQAGLGWMGKNTLLLTQSLGSWVFLGALLTSIEIEPDRPHADHCGTCTRCLEACPTAAFPAPGVLDSNRCISYWTIEHRGEFPEGAGEELFGWLFGCDDCQTVCPWNRHQKPHDEPEFDLREPFASSDLRVYAQWTYEEWDGATQGTAFRRPGYAGWIRNANAVLANERPDTGRPRNLNTTTRGSRDS